jgi:hypothetical protein
MLAGDLTADEILLLLFILPGLIGENILLMLYFDVGDNKRF